MHQNVQLDENISRTINHYTYFNFRNIKGFFYFYYR